MLAPSPDGGEPVEVELVRFVTPFGGPAVFEQDLTAFAPLLYGRYDMVELDDGRQALLEAELFEPCFFLSVDEDAADRFAAAVARRVGAAA